MPTLRVYKQKERGSRCWRWKLVDGGKTICHGAEPFSSVYAVRKTLNTIRETMLNIRTLAATKGRIKSKRDPMFCFKRNMSKEKTHRESWHWTLRSANFRILAMSARSFQSSVKAEEHCRFAETDFLFAYDRFKELN